MKTLLLIILISAMSAVAEETNTIWYADTNVLHCGFNSAQYPVVYFVGQGKTYQLQESKDLINWTTIQTIASPSDKARLYTRSLGTPTSFQTNPPTFFKLLY